MEPTSIIFENFTSIIGRNDVGKSTILESLEVFFNGGKPDRDDININGQGRVTKITCAFSELPEEVVLDATVPTTLAAEYLQNAQGLLEIVKEYDLSDSRIVPKVFARALHPSTNEYADLLQLNNAKLKARAETLGVDLSEIDQRINTQIRRAIWSHGDALDLQERLIPLNEEEAKKVWVLLEKEMPTFALFQADRPSRDDDSEVTDPFDAAIKDALKTLQPQIDAIKEQVQVSVKEVADRTLAKLRKMDDSLADELRAEFRTDPKWGGFKLALADQRNIPINKRGSGVRRLVLLNFFRAEAERRQHAANAPGIVYAIEEPESSQHPTNQKMLINALLELSVAEKTQVLITTHVPGIAALVPPNSIRYVHHDEKKHPRIVEGDEDVLKFVADQLGVLPDKRVRLLIYVEGPNDASFLEYISRICAHIDLAEDPRIAFVLTGGGNLKHWVNQQYLRGLNLREFHIYDRDNDHAYQAQVDAVNARDNGDFATLTTKREIENYLHPEAIRRALGIELNFGDDDDVPILAAEAIHVASESDKAWADVDDENQEKKASRAKRRLCVDAVSRMTREMLVERDPNDEVDGWMRRILATVG